VASDHDRRAVEAVLIVRDTMQVMADYRITDLIGGIVDATADTGIMRADRWSMAVHSVLTAAAKLVSQQEPER